MQEPRNEAQRTEQSKLSPSSRAGWPRRCTVTKHPLPQAAQCSAALARPCAAGPSSAGPCRGRLQPNALRANSACMPAGRPPAYNSR